MQKSITSYDILNISEQSTQVEIHDAYRRLAKKWHPDFHQEANPERANRNFLLLQDAYEKIRTPDRRTEYNQKIARLNRLIRQNQNRVINDNHSVMGLFKTLESLFTTSDKNQKAL